MLFLKYCIKYDKSKLTYTCLHLDLFTLIFTIHDYFPKELLPLI